MEPSQAGEEFADFISRVRAGGLAYRMAEARARRFGWHLREAERAVGAGQAEPARFHLDCVRDEPFPDGSFSCRRARLLLRFGEWKRSADDYAAWFAGDTPDEGAAWLGYTRALLIAGNAPVYEKLCQRLEREIDGHPAEPILWHAARVFGLAPHPASAARSRKAIELASQRAGNHRRPDGAFLRGRRTIARRTGPNRWPRSTAPRPRNPPDPG